MFGLGGNSRLNRRWGNGLIKGIRPLGSNAEITGYRVVDPGAEFLPGMGAALTTLGGKTVVTRHDGSATAPVLGLFINSKTNSFYKATAETFVAGTAPYNITLKNANVKDVRITTLSGAAFTGTFTVNTVNGIVNVTVQGNIASGETGIVYYSYKDLTVVGFDQTLGSGRVAVLESNSEVALLVYDTSVAYTLGGTVGINADGLVSSPGTSPAIGFVTKVPSVNNPELHVQLRF
ncbi:MAG: hypothetical protein ABIK31_00335 [candidate division WOR-3 bacterium]